jgi:hypothetical protein
MNPIALGDLEGTVITVEEYVAGTELSAAASAAATTIEVVDIDELDFDGGTLAIGDEVIAYTIDEDSEEITLATGLASGYSAEEPVTVYPPSIERYAWVRVDDSDEDLEARVPHALFDRFPLGIRAEDDETAELVTIALEDDQWSITDVRTIEATTTLGDPEAQAVELDQDGVRLTDEAGVELVNLPTDGSRPRFAGVIEALGLDLPLADGDNPPGIGTLVDEFVGWRPDDAWDADLLAGIYGFRTFGGDEAWLKAFVRNAAGEDHDPVIARTLSGGDWGSSFARCVNTSVMKIEAGFEVFNVGASPGGSSSDIDTAFLGSVDPDDLIITATVRRSTGAGTNRLLATVARQDATNFRVDVRDTSGSNINGNVRIDWVAIYVG